MTNCVSFCSFDSVLTLLTSLCKTIISSRYWCSGDFIAPFAVDPFLKNAEKIKNIARFSTASAQWVEVRSRSGRLLYFCYNSSHFHLNCCFDSSSGSFLKEGESNGLEISERRFALRYKTRAFSKVYILVDSWQWASSHLDRCSSSLVATQPCRLTVLLSDAE